MFNGSTHTKTYMLLLTWKNNKYWLIITTLMFKIFT